MMELDLFGHPLRKPRGAPGQPPHQPDDEKRNKIMLLFAQGYNQEKVAQIMNISLPTLKKYYSFQCAEAGIARARLKARMLDALVKQALDGKTAAAEKVLKRMDKLDLASAPVATAAAPNMAKMGKKQQRALLAAEGHRNTEWDGLVKQPPVRH